MNATDSHSHVAWNATDIASFLERQSRLVRLGWDRKDTADVARRLTDVGRPGTGPARRQTIHQTDH